MIRRCCTTAASPTPTSAGTGKPWPTSTARRPYRAPTCQSCERSETGVWSSPSRPPTSAGQLYDCHERRPSHLPVGPFRRADLSGHSDRRRRRRAVRDDHRLARQSFGAAPACAFLRGPDRPRARCPTRGGPLLRQHPRRRPDSRGPPLRPPRHRPVPDRDVPDGWPARGRGRGCVAAVHPRRAATRRGPHHRGCPSGAGRGPLTVAADLPPSLIPGADATVTPGRTGFGGTGPRPVGDLVCGTGEGHGRGGRRPSVRVLGVGRRRHRVGAGPRRGLLLAVSVFGSVLVLVAAVLLVLAFRRDAPTSPVRAAAPRVSS